MSNCNDNYENESYEKFLNNPIDIFFKSNTVQKIIKKVDNDFLGGCFTDQNVSMFLDFDLYNDDENYYINIDIPGIYKNDIDIQISVERKSNIKKEFIKQERKCGIFTKKIYLDKYIVHDSLKSSYEDGVLKIKILKSKIENKKFTPSKACLCEVI
jgi:HSP20 family molecular chaperone IbpA